MSPDDGTLTWAVREAIRTNGGVKRTARRAGVVRPILSAWAAGDYRKHRPLSVFRVASALKQDSRDWLRRSGFLPTELFVRLFEKMVANFWTLDDLKRSGLSAASFNTLAHGRFPNRDHRWVLRRLLDMDNMQLKELLKEFPTLHRLRENGRRRVGSKKKRGGRAVLTREGRNAQAYYRETYTREKRAAIAREIGELRRGLSQRRSKAGRVALLFHWEDLDGNRVQASKPVVEDDRLYVLNRQEGWTLCVRCGKLNLKHFGYAGNHHGSCENQFRHERADWLLGLNRWRGEGKSPKSYLARVAPFPRPEKPPHRIPSSVELAETLGWCLRRHVLGHSAGSIAREIGDTDPGRVEKRMKYFMEHNLPSPGLAISANLRKFVKPLQASIIGRVTDSLRISNSAGR
jgi:hypothetical protein